MEVLNEEPFADTVLQIPPPEIIADARGVAYIGGTSMKVRYIVLQHLQTNETAEEIQKAYPALSIQQVQAALRYYEANQAKIDAEIADEERLVTEMRAQSNPGITRDRLLERRDRLRTA